MKHIMAQVLSEVKSYLSQYYYLPDISGMAELQKERGVACRS
jgi:hypothetical protein